MRYVYAQSIQYCSFGSAHEMLVLLVLLDFSFTVKAAPHECVIRTGQP